MTVEIDSPFSLTGRRLGRRGWGTAGRVRPAVVSSFMQSEPNFYPAQNLANLIHRMCLRRFRVISGPRKRTQSKPRTGGKGACRAKVSSDAPNKANSRRFWLENRGSAAKQSQFCRTQAVRAVNQAYGLASGGREATMIQSRIDFRDFSGVTGPGGRPVRMRRIAAKGGLS